MKGIYRKFKGLVRKFATKIPIGIVELLSAIIAGFSFALLTLQNWNYGRIQTIILLLTLCVSLVSIWIAYESLRLTKQSQDYMTFSNLFNTQISLLKGYFNADEVMRTELKQKMDENIQVVTDSEREAKIEKEAPVYKNFCTYFIENANRIGNSELNERQICNIWQTYCNHLKYRSEFEYSFKFIFMCVEVVKQSRLSKKEKQSYIRVITNLINSEQLFCYFVNQVADCDGYCDSETVRILRDNNFFLDMFNSPIYEEVKKKIPHRVVRWFSLPS